MPSNGGCRSVVLRVRDHEKKDPVKVSTRKKKRGTNFIGIDSAIGTKNAFAW